jgi:hypothetical protein
MSLSSAQQQKTVFPYFNDDVFRSLHIHIVAFDGNYKELVLFCNSLNTTGYPLLKMSTFTSVSAVLIQLNAVL